MKILFFSHYFYPHIGGVEKHTLELSRELIKLGHSVTIITEKYDKRLKNEEFIEGIKVIRINYPKIKYFGLFFIWLNVLKNYSLILNSDIIHIHDVFIWYLLFRFLFFWKNVYITIHGFESGDPFTFNSILQKKIAVKLSTKSIGVGGYLEKYYKVKFDNIIYGSTSLALSERKVIKKQLNSIIFVERLEKDTGIIQFLEWVKDKKMKVGFVGDGSLRKKCEKIGKVYGFTNPDRYLKAAEYVVPGGYLACLEAFSNKCKVKVFWSNKLREDYWKMSPMWKFIESEDVGGAHKLVEANTWSVAAKNYLNLWSH